MNPPDASTSIAGSPLHTISAGMTRRVLAHFETDTLDVADGTVTVPTSVFTDWDRFRADQELMQRSPHVVAWAGEIMTVQSLVAGDDVQVVTAMQTNNGLNMGIAPNASDIKSLADLKGKRIGYAEGTSQQAFVLRGLDKAGLSVDDVELVPMSLPDFPDALRSNQIDAAPMSEPVFSRYMQTPGATSLPRPEIEDLSEGISYLYSSKKALSDPATAAAIRAYVTAYIKSVAWANDNRDAYIDTYFVKSQGLTAEDGQRILDTAGITTFPHLDEDLIAIQQHTIDVIDAAGELPKPVEAADAFDLRFDEVVTAAVAESGAAHTRS